MSPYALDSAGTAPRDLFTDHIERDHRVRSQRAGERNCVKAGRFPTVQALAQIIGIAGSHEQIDRFIAEDIVWVMARGPDPWGRKYEGAEAVRQALVDRFASIPDAQLDWVLHDFLVAVLEEDREMVDSMQRGMASRIFDPGPLSRMEVNLHSLINYNLDRIFDGA